jgi:YVTN family beta-propeller protein
LVLNILYRTQIISSFVSILLTAGTISSFHPSLLSMKEVYAIPDFNNDNFVCNNINLNINGLSIDAISNPLSNLLQDNIATENVDVGTGKFSNEGERSSFHEDFSSVCINNNANEVIISTTPPTSLPCEVTVDTITGLGSTPIGIAHDPDNSRMYVTNQDDGTVSVIDTTTNTVIGTLTVGSTPIGIAHDPDNDRMYVTNAGDGTVSVIDTTTNTVDSTPLQIGNDPVGIAHDPVNDRMYVTNQNIGTVSVIDTTTNTVDPATIPVGAGPLGIAHDPDNSRMYVINQDDGTVSVIDTTTNTVIDTISVGSGSRGIAYDSVNNRMYVTNPLEGTVSVINLC